MKIIIRGVEMDDAFDKAFKKLYSSSTFKKLYSSSNPWFNTEEEAEDWAGDVAFDFTLDVLEQLGIEVE